MSQSVKQYYTESRTEIEAQYKKSVLEPIFDFFNYIQYLLGFRRKIIVSHNGYKFNIYRI